MEENQTQKITAKQRVLEAQGKEVPLDLFLYSCLEHERILATKKNSPLIVSGWPELAEGRLKTDSTFAGEMERMVKWYGEQYPAMRDKHPLDHERLADVIPPFVALTHDLDELHKRTSGTNVPKYAVGASEQPSVWSEIDRCIGGNFPSFQKLFLRYLQWTHGEEKVETFEPGSRPPVGKYAPPPLRTGDRDRGRGGRDGGRPARGGDRPPRGGDRPPRGGDRGGRSEGPREARGDRPPRGDHGRPQRESHDQDRKPRGDRGPRRGGDNDERTAKLSEAALSEVDQALDNLRSNSSMQEVLLKPTNSFYRRLQHQKIVDAGFASTSVGEGPDRAVKISRKGS